METGLLKKYDENDKKFVIAKELMRSVNALMVSNRMHIAARRLTYASGLYGSELKNPMELHTLSLKGSIVKEMLSYDEKFIDSVMDILNGCKDIDKLTYDKKNDVILMALYRMYGSFDCIENRESKYECIRSLLQDEDYDEFHDIFKIAMTTDFENRVNKFEAKLQLMRNSIQLMYGNSQGETS